jgi:hypothetical protein
MRFSICLAAARNCRGGREGDERDEELNEKEGIARRAAKIGQ